MSAGIPKQRRIITIFHSQHRYTPHKKPTWGRPLYVPSQKYITEGESSRVRRQVYSVTDVSYRPNWNRSCSLYPQGVATVTKKCHRDWTRLLFVLLRCTDPWGYEILNEMWKWRLWWLTEWSRSGRRLFKCNIPIKASEVWHQTRTPCIHYSVQLV
jgi:hypothetical protein